MKKTKYTVALWERMQKALELLFRDMYSDQNIVTDYSRILRVPNSINGKHNAKVRILRKNNVKYSIDELKELLLHEIPTSQQPATESQIKKIKEIEKTQGITIPEQYYSNKKNASHTISRYYKPAKITDKQINYIKILCDKKNIDAENVMNSINDRGEAWEWIQNNLTIKKHRNKKSSQCIDGWIVGCITNFIIDNPDNKYRREVLLFITRLALIHLYNGDFSEAANKVCELNELFSEPFPRRKILMLTKSAEKIYKEKPEKYYSPDSIEEKIYNGDVHIRPYFGQHRLKRDRSDYQKDYYAKKLIKQGKTTKKRDLENKISEIKVIAEQNTELAKIELIRMIASKYNVSERTARRYLDSAKNEEFDNRSIPDKKRANNAGMPGCLPSALRSDIQSDKNSTPILLSKASGYRGLPLNLGRHLPACCGRTLPTRLCLHRGPPA